MGHLWKLIKEGITTNKIVDRRDIHWEKWKYIFIIKPDLFIHVVDLF